ncbi:MAG: phosphatase PAP2 family protein [Chromatiales bacterium]
MNESELGLCLAWNRSTRYRSVLALFRLVSRLGNGVFWYALIAVLPVIHGQAGLAAGAHMLLVGGFCLALYKAVKGVTTRDRPCDCHTAIRPGVPPLDDYSFPSGHTLHAVGFSLVAMAYFPELAVVLVPFTALTGASRVVLGLHYPSDVLVGAVLGAFIASASFALY